MMRAKSVLWCGQVVFLVFGAFHYLLSLLVDLTVTSRACARAPEGGAGGIDSWLVYPCPLALILHLYM